jgi:hypothetical protein
MTQTAKPPIAVPPAAGQSPAQQDAAVSALVRMSARELNDLFRRSPAGPVPVGDSKGTAIILPGTLTARVLRQVARLFFWQGKVFDPRTKGLLNKVGPFSARAIPAAVYVDKSWLDGKDAVIIDYSNSWKAARMIRDEIRLVQPGVYLGKVWIKRSESIFFVLQF